MAAESMSLRDMLFWFFITLFGTGTYVIYGSQTPTGQMLGIAMMVVGFVGMFCCAWPHLARYLNSRPRLTAVFFVVSLALLTFIMHSHQQYHGWRSYLIIGVLGAVLLCICWLIAGVVPKSVRTRAVGTDKPLTAEECFPEPEPATGDAAKAVVEAKGPPITLKQLFEIGWPNLPAFYHECILDSQIFESGPVKVAWRVNGDFVGRSKFLAILIDPATKVSDAFKACEAIADQFGHFIDSPNSEVDIQGQAPDDTAPTHLKDMVFSKRIFIYYEDFSLAQKGLLETIYQSKELSVQFRDAAYAWAHRDDKPRATPLVPNSTILPDAKLAPGLRIKITKLSPGKQHTEMKETRAILAAKEGPIR